MGGVPLGVLEMRNSRRCRNALFCIESKQPGGTGGDECSRSGREPGQPRGARVVSELSSESLIAIRVTNGHTSRPSSSESLIFIRVIHLHPSHLLLSESRIVIRVIQVIRSAGSRPACATGGTGGSRVRRRRAAALPSPPALPSPTARRRRRSAVAGSEPAAAAAESTAAGRRRRILCGGAFCAEHAA